MKKGGITNKSLIALLVIAMVVSLGGTFISLSRLGKIGSRYVTGKAESGTGEVKIMISSLLSISIVAGKGGVDFGSCKPSLVDKFFASDDGTLDDLPGDPGYCSGATFPQYIEVMNDGNIDANVTIQTDDNELIPGVTNTSIWFKTQNASENPGCMGIYDWLNFTKVGSKYNACDNLTHLVSPTRNRFATAFRIWVPSTASGGEDTAAITYTAHAIG